MLLYKLSAPVHRQANAPRQWFEHVWEQHSLDACLFLRRSADEVVALLGRHVDDVVCCCLKGKEHLLKAVEQAFTWGAPWDSGEFTFIGRTVKQWRDGSITLDQASYVADVHRGEGSL